MKRNFTFLLFCVYLLQHIIAGDFVTNSQLALIDSIVNDGICMKAFPGCQVIVLKDGLPVYDKCFGYYTYDNTQKVVPTTMYDLASLSKTTGTLLAIMKLYDEGALKLSDKISVYLTFLAGTDKENLTISDLLYHETGLPGSIFCYKLIIEKPDKNSTSALKIDPKTDFLHISKSLKFKNGWISKTPSTQFNLQVSDSLFVNNDLHAQTMKKIANIKLADKTFHYSCVNFILLKEIVESISGKSLDLFLSETFYSPMKLENITYLPLRTHNKDQIAPTLKNDNMRKGTIQGFVHDPDAAFLGGISGNAGLFATAHDVAAIYEMLLNNGKYEGRSYLSEETCKLFTTSVSDSKRRRLGFDKPFPENPVLNPCCNSAPTAVYGHTGYTGTCCWVDPVNKMVYVFLSNRTYPNDGENKLAKMSIRPKIQEVIYKNITNQFILYK